MTKLYGEDDKMKISRKYEFKSLILSIITLMILVL